MTNTLSTMGYREIDMAADLLKQYADGTNAWMSSQDEENFNKDGIELQFNPNSGYVFLTNEDYQVLMLNDNNKLEMFLSCGNCGAEGLRSEVNFVNNSLCNNCDLMNETTHPCDECKKEFPEDKLNYNGKEHLCENCYESVTN